MTEIAKRIDEVIGVSLVPLLKEDGYRKSARTFRRAKPRCVQVINVQASWTNVGSEGQFTVNLGVYFPEAAGLHGGFRITDSPTESDCVVSQRIGQLMPQGLDHWWKITAATDLSPLGDEIRQTYTQYGQPWLDSHTDVAHARDFVLSLRSEFWGAIFSLLLDERNEAARCLERAIHDAKDSPELLTQLRQWGRQHGLVQSAAV